MDLMVVIRIKGRTFNQLFLAALAKQLESQGEKVYIDDFSNFSPSKRPKQFIYDLFPKFNLKVLDPKRVIKIRHPRFYQRKWTIIEDNGIFNPEVLHTKWRHVYLDGFWQSEKYFSNPKVREFIRSVIVPPTYLKDNAIFQSMVQKVTTINSVSIHIRRTDYLNKYNIGIYGNICTKDYYDNAIQYIKSRVPDAHFYIFSDDKDYIKKHFNGEDFTIVDSENQHDLFDFFLMRYCKHHIIANATFSWWAAWLDDNPESIICSPEKWLNTQEWDIYTPRMIKIPIEKKD